MNEIKLSQKQQEIVNSKQNAISVIATAGSGKTRIITERIRQLLLKTKRKILALTFTNKAAGEMKERLKEVSDIRSRTFIGTFHGFCQTVLENHGHYIGFDKLPHIFEEQKDRGKLVEQALNDSPALFNKYSRNSQKKKNKILSDILDFISTVKREMISENEISNLLKTKGYDQDFSILYNSYQDILNAQNAIDFDDLLLLTRKLFYEYPKVAELYQKSYEYIFVDEAQDLNRAQYELLLALIDKERNKVMMVGDPHQSIFAFNGSSSKFLTENFQHDFNAEVHRLNENYRSSKRVLEAAEKVIPTNSSIEEHTVIEGRFEFTPLTNEVEEAEWVFSKIQELLQIKNYDDIEGEVTTEKIAILARNKYVFKPIEELLQQNNMKYYYKMNSGSVKFESRLMNIFYLALKVRLNPKDKLHSEQLYGLLGISNKKSETEVDIRNLMPSVESNLEKKVLGLVEALKDDGVNLLKETKSLTDEIKKSDEISSEDEKRMILNDVQELENNWKNYAKGSEKRSLLKFKNSMVLGQTRSQKKHAGITFSTVHTMKGQEFDIVFIIGIDDGTFPDYRAIKNQGVELEQEKNNLYVAITRAKRFLYITYPENRMMPWGDRKQRVCSRFLKGVCV